METNTTASENHIGGKVDNLLLQSAQCNDTMTLINNNLSQIGVTFDSFKAQAQKHMEVSTVGMSSMQSQLAEIVQALDSTESEMVFKRML
ncbi:hypothetical protein COL154_002778 [Colletotrichum chrysophilum]|nr:hypothetical protein COL154_002778 [Colletotrichum chrysophilum]